MTTFSVAVERLPDEVAEEGLEERSPGLLVHRVGREDLVEGHHEVVGVELKKWQDRFRQRSVLIRTTNESKS